MLEIKLNMNSPAQEVLAFKTCCSLKFFDQNLEILVTNRGETPVVVPSYFDLETDGGIQRFHALLPHGEQHIEPGEIKAFYCTMDEEVWQKARRLMMYDLEGNRYAADVSGP